LKQKSALIIGCGGLGERKRERERERYRENE
jgi:hypothetical protein